MSGDILDVQALRFDQRIQYRREISNVNDISQTEHVMKSLMRWYYQERVSSSPPPASYRTLAAARYHEAQAASDCTLGENKEAAEGPMYTNSSSQTLR